MISIGVQKILPSWCYSHSSLFRFLQEPLIDKKKHNISVLKVSFVGQFVKAFARAGDLLILSCQLPNQRRIFGSLSSLNLFRNLYKIRINLIFPCCCSENRHIISKYQMYRRNLTVIAVRNQELSTGRFLGILCHPKLFKLLVNLRRPQYNC